MTVLSLLSDTASLWYKVCNLASWQAIQEATNLLELTHVSSKKPLWVYTMKSNAVLDISFNEHSETYLLAASVGISSQIDLEFLHTLEPPTKTLFVKDI